MREVPDRHPLSFSVYFLIFSLAYISLILLSVTTPTIIFLFLFSTLFFSTLPLTFPPIIPSANLPIGAVEAVVLSEKLCSLNRQTNVGYVVIVMK